MSLNPLHHIPYLYVENIEGPYRERGLEHSAHYGDTDSPNPDLSRIYKATRDMTHKEVCEWVCSHRGDLSEETFVIENLTKDPLEARTSKTSLIVCLQPFNTIPRLNDFLAMANGLLEDSGTIALYGETSGMRRNRILSKYPGCIGRIAEVSDYLWSRVLIKLYLIRPLILRLSRGSNRNYSRVEVLGRIARAGFEICGDEIRGGVFSVCAVRTAEPVSTKPHYGLFVRLPRSGKDGKPIGVYKLRTMYAYSEYIQDYAYSLYGLERGGKLNNDFRVNMVGAFCRSRFIDEIPMFINYFKGDLKLVGVRPLSRHYLSLYTPEMQALHLSVKPGIIPPLYYDYPKPDTLQEIQESERRYIESYKAKPFRTDLRYFFGICRNVIFRRERSH